MKNITLCIGWLVCLLATHAGATTVTLSEEALLALDHHSSDLLTPHVSRQQHEANGGVRFDINFPGNTPFDTQLLYSSVREMDISDYDAFLLKFTFLSIDGIDPVQVPDLGFYVSPFIKDAAGLNRFWELDFIDLKHGGSPSVAPGLNISTLSVGKSKPGDRIYEMGFEVRMDSDYLNPDGFTLSLLVEPAPGAMPIPEPASVLLLALGGLILNKRLA